VAFNALRNPNNQSIWLLAAMGLFSLFIQLPQSPLPEPIMVTACANVVAAMMIAALTAAIRRSEITDTSREGEGGGGYKTIILLCDRSARPTPRAAFSALATSRAQRDLRSRPHCAPARTVA